MSSDRNYSTVSTVSTTIHTIGWLITAGLVGFGNGFWSGVWLWMTWPYYLGKVIRLVLWHV